MRWFFPVWTFLFLVLAILALVPSLHRYGWFLRIYVLEWGYLAVLVGLLPFLLLFEWDRIKRVSFLAFLGVSVGLMYPLVSGYFLSRELHASPHPFFKNNGLGTVISLPILVKGYTFQKKYNVTSYAFSLTDRSDLRLDYYYNAVSEKRPCVLVIHGGGWDGGNKRELQDLNYFLSETGYAVAALDYRLAPEYTYPAPVKDVGEAIRFLCRKSTEFGIDTNSFALLGRSAGGQIALMSAYTRVHPGIKAVVSMYAPTDLAWGYHLPQNPWVLDGKILLWQYLGGPPEKQARAYAAASPVNFVTKTCPPTLLIHGRSDELVAFGHSTRLKQKLDSAGVSNYLLDLPWATHGFDHCFNGPGSQLSNFAISRFLYHCFFQKGKTPSI